MPVKERGLLFTPENYGKCEDGSKTQTRRIMTPQPGPDAAWFSELRTSGKDDGLWFPMKGNPKDSEEWEQAEGKVLKCPYGTVGDRLYVKESIYIDHFEYFEGPLPKTKPDLDDGMLVYRRDGTCCQQFAECECGGKGAPWRSPLFMPKWAARLWLEITDVRVERLQEISIGDAMAEGCRPGDRNDRYAAVEKFKLLWESNKIHKPGSFDLNPWVWVLSFKKVTA